MAGLWGRSLQGFHISSVLPWFCSEPAGKSRIREGMVPSLRIVAMNGDITAGSNAKVQVSSGKGSMALMSLATDIQRGAGLKG